MSKKKLKVPVEVYSRVVGYFRPVQQWHKGKQQEFKERKTFDMKKISGRLSNDQTGTDDQQELSGVERAGGKRESSAGK